MTTTDLALPSLSDVDALSTAAPGSTPTANIDLESLVDDLLGELGGIFERMEWAEEEVQKACARYPRQADLIWHAGFPLLRPTHDRMEYEVVYRAHCREMLDRLAAGEDTRPGTAVEICCALRDMSLMTPLRSSAVGLYMRMWLAAGLPEFPELVEACGNHEALEKSRIDDNEAFSRRKLAVADRRVGVIECSGRHHGEEVNCVYAPAPQLALGV